MAYKFQRGKATLSGSISAEEGLKGTLGIDDLDIDGATDIGEGLADADLMVVDNGAGGTNRKSAVSRIPTYVFTKVSGDATVASNGALTIAANAVEGSMLNSNVKGAGINYSSNVLSVNASPDSFSVSDGDGLTLSSSVAGAGLNLNLGILSVDIDELAALGGTGLHQTQDHFIFSDNGTEKKITFSNLQDAIFADVSGDATIAAGGALTIAAQSVENSMLADDAVGADELAANAVVNASIASNAAIDMDKLDGGSLAASLTDLAQGDLLYAGDIDDSNNLKSITFSNLEDAIFGNVSGDATVAAGGALTIAANAVQDSMVNDDVATGLAGDGLSAASGVMAVDLSGSTDNGLVVSADGLAINTRDQNGLDVDSNNRLRVKIDGSSGLTLDSGGLTIDALGVTNAMLAGSIADSKLSTISTAGKVALSALELDGGTDIGAALSDGDLIIVDDGADGTMRKSTVSRIPTYVFAQVSGDATVADGGALTIAANAVEDSMVNDNVATGLAGDGLSAASGVMAVAVSGAIAINSDKLGIPKSVFGPGLKPNGPTNFTNDVRLNVSPDSFGLADGDGLFLSSSVAGAGIALTAGVLSLDIDELSALGGTGLHQTQDFFAFSDNGTEKKVSFSNLQDAVFSGVSGDASIAAGGALTIGDGAVESDMLADNIISGQGALGGASVAQADLLLIDDGPGTVKKVTFSNFEDSIFGNVSGDATVAAGGALTIANGAVENDMLAGSIANGKLVNSAITIAGTSVSLGGAITALAGITDLDAAQGDLTIFDTNNASSTLTIGAASGKVKIAGDLQVVGTVETVNATQLRIEDMLIVTARSASTNAAINGAGIQFGDGTNNNGGALLFKNDATYGQLLDAVDGDHSGSIDLRAKSFVGDLVGNVVQTLRANAAGTQLFDLQSGINTFASASIPQSASLPPTPETGSVVHVKADESCDSVRFVKIQSHADHSQKIDGDDYIVLESPYAGLSLMYVGKNKWIVL